MPTCPACHNEIAHEDDPCPHCGVIVSILTDFDWGGRPAEETMSFAEFVAAVLELQGKLHEAACEIASLSGSKWTGWVYFLLQILERETTTDAPATYESNLQDLLKSISERLEKGRWKAQRE
jgi:hypothetical protein